MGLFSLEVPAAPAPQMPERPEGKTAAAVQAFEEMHVAKVANIRKNVAAPPGPGEMLFLWTTAQFNTMSMIIWLIESLGNIDELIVSTYSISNICCQTLFDWLDKGKIRSVYLYLSDYVPRMSPAKWDYLKSAVAARAEKVRIGLGFNHSKVTLASTGGGG